MRRAFHVMILVGWFLGGAQNVVRGDGREKESSEQRYIKVSVKNKPTDKNWKLRDTRTIELLPNFQPGVKTIQYSKYGGRADAKALSTGYFYPKKVADRWWLVDPAGNLFIHVGVCAVYRGKSVMSRKPAVEKFGTWTKWAEFSTSLLAEYGFNGTGGWSEADLLRAAPRPLVYTLSWSFMGSFGRAKNLVWQEPGHLGYPNRCIPVFHPDFETFCDDYAKHLSATKDDPWLVGHFSDNELPIVIDMLDRSLALDVTNPDLRHGYEAARQWFNKTKGKAAGPNDITDADRQAFLTYAVETYFRITTNAIRKYDANHLCLGPRLHGKALGLPNIFRTAGKYLDVIAVNCYGAWGPNTERMAMWIRESGRPFMITEFYAKGQDSGLPNNTGAGWLVETQKDRGRFYQHFTLGLLESKSCVGWHWFKYRDNNP
ncbi:MAG: hypothetical protein JSW59_05715, partial [Phycisphaerales bacterium]